MNSVSKKEHLRQLCKQALQQFCSKPNSAARAVAESQIQKNILTYVSAHCGVWGAFRPMGFEPHIEGALKQVSGLQWAYPRMQEDLIQWWVPGAQGFTQSTLGFEEPVADSATQVATKDLQGILIPGLGFDSKGVRLGRGQGHFDKSLNAYTGTKIAVAFACQLVDEIPVEAHDVKMDFVITENAVIAC
jgi:5-formyltetrahydrofolate cyclo-ligase